MQPWQRLLVSLLAGALMPLSLAPLDWAPLALVSPALLAYLCHQLTPREIFRISYSYGFGLFAVGASWVHVSIHEYAYTPLPLSVAMTTAFVAFLALIFALPFLLLNRTGKRSTSGFLLVFCGVWVLGEWLRSWLLTGFPWLLLGYSQLHLPLSGWAPIGGIYLVTLGTVFTAVTLSYYLIGSPSRLKTVFAALTLLIWVAGWGLQSVHWTSPTGAKRQVALIQANIPQEMKWSPGFLQETLFRYESLSATHWDADWLIWPEAAVPLLFSQADTIIRRMDERALATNTSFITGIIYDEPERQQFYNSTIGLGLAEGVYHKTRLVPFGEYVPLEDWLRGLISFFDLPMSTIAPGQPGQTGMRMDELPLASAICYEIVYPDLVARSSIGAGTILTISNDAWFGHSWGPLQHLQMAQMRAIETGRYVVRATNNGISAIINPQGRIEQRSEQFVQATVRGIIQPHSGNTPFMMSASWPTIMLAVLLVVTGQLLCARSKG